MLDSREHNYQLRRGDAVVGRLVVGDSSTNAIDVSGGFIPGPDFESCRATFEAARNAAARVDSASDAEYQQAWYEWRAACDAIEALELSFGEHRAPIESFSIESDWRVEFAIPLWWLISEGGWGNAE